MYHQPQILIAGILLSPSGIWPAGPPCIHINTTEDPVVVGLPEVLMSHKHGSSSLGEISRPQPEFSESRSGVVFGYVLKMPAGC